jgi:hypothetical protein
VRPTNAAKHELYARCRCLPSPLSPSPPHRVLSPERGVVFRCSCNPVTYILGVRSLLVKQGSKSDQLSFSSPACFFGWTRLACGPHRCRTARMPATSLSEPVRAAGPSNRCAHLDGLLRCNAHCVSVSPAGARVNVTRWRVPSRGELLPGSAVR